MIGRPKCFEKLTEILKRFTSTLVGFIPVVVVHGGHVAGQRVGPGGPPGPGRVDGGVGAGEVLGQRGAPLRGRAEHALQRRGRRRGRRQHHLVATILLIVHFFHSSPFSVAVVVLSLWGSLPSPSHSRSSDCKATKKNQTDVDWHLDVRSTRR